MSETKLVKETEYLLAWFLFFLCASVVCAAVGSAAGAVAGFIVGFIMVLAGSEDPNPILGMVAGGVAGFIVSVPVSYLFFRIFVAKIIVKRIRMRISQVPPAAEDNVRRRTEAT